MDPLSRPIDDTPIFHWFVVSIVVFGLVMSSGQAPWWVQAILWVVLLVLLGANSAFHSRTTLKREERCVEFARLTPIGRRVKRLSFDEISEVRVQLRLWGDKNSRQFRGTLKVCTLNGAENVIYSNPDFRRLNRLAEALRAGIGLRTLSEPLAPLDDPAWLSATQRASLQALCTEAIDGERILGSEALGEGLRKNLEQNLGLPLDEPLLCFLNTALGPQGRFGLAIGARGLYWANDGDLKEHTKLTRLSWRALQGVTLKLDPLDDDIMIDELSQIGRGVFSDSERLLALLHALQAVVSEEGEPDAQA